MVSAEHVHEAEDVLPWNMLKVWSIPSTEEYGEPLREVGDPLLVLHMVVDEKLVDLGLDVPRIVKYMLT